MQYFNSTQVEIFNTPIYTILIFTSFICIYNFSLNKSNCDLEYFNKYIDIFFDVSTLYRQYHTIVWLYKVYDNPKIMQYNGGSSWRVTISNNDLLKPRPTCWENQASRVVAKTTPKNPWKTIFFHIAYNLSHYEHT